MLGDVCVVPYLSQENRVPWYFGPLAARIPFRPLYVDRTMTGHIRLRDNVKALDYQLSKAQHLAPDFVPPEMSSSISMSTVLSALCRISWMLISAIKKGSCRKQWTSILLSRTSPAPKAPNGVNGWFRGLNRFKLAHF